MKRERIIGKVLLRGELELLSPLLIGSGGQREGSDVDTQVLLDKTGRPFIPGTSVAGVLRAALDKPTANAFFGDTVEISDNGQKRALEVQSAVNIDDVELSDNRTVLRDGVCIDMVRGVAADEKKFDYELVERGATGEFRAEITLRGYHREVLADIPGDVRKLAEGVAAGFRLGAMTAKGFGKVRVRGLQVDRYDFENEDDVAAWLSKDRGPAVDHEDISAAEGKALTGSNLTVDADFALTGSLIVKDTEVPPDKQKGDSPIHAVMKKSKEEYLIPGPSVKGALRHHADRILERLGIPDTKDFLNGLMGLEDEAMKEAKKWEKAHPKAKKRLRQSRFFVDEVYIDENAAKPFAQTRNRIDRFTGGTIGGALFTTEAVWGKGGNPPVHIHFEIRDADDAEAGLALLLLKDLSLGRVPLGGEKSVGRGVLEGKRAEIRYTPKGSKEEIKAVIEDGRLVEKEKEKDLQRCVDALAAMADRAEVAS